MTFLKVVCAFLFHDWDFPASDLGLVRMCKRCGTRQEFSMSLGKWL